MEYTDMRLLPSGRISVYKKKMKITLRVPTAQYAYLELNGKEEELDKMIAIYDKYGETPLNINKGTFSRIKSFTGETILYDPIKHIYLDEDKNKLMGGSTFAAMFFPKFPKDLISERMAKKNDVPKESILELWAANAKMSCDFGSAIHLMLENYWKFKDNPCYKKSKHPILNEILSSFPALDVKGKVIPEALVSCVQRKMVGQIDMLEITGDKKCKLSDYKTSGDIKKDLEKYYIQLNYYARILKEDGWEIEDMIIYNYNGEWETFDVPTIDLNSLKIKQ